MCPGSFRKLPGVVSTNIGYADSPDHVNIFKRRNCSSVLSGDGSSIVVRVEYDPTQITYTELLQVCRPGSCICLLGFIGSHTWCTMHTYKKLHCVFGMS